MNDLDSWLEPPELVLRLDGLILGLHRFRQCRSVGVHLGPGDLLASATLPGSQAEYRAHEPLAGQDMHQERAWLERLAHSPTISP
jgi:hypothetical protein